MSGVYLGRNDECIERVSKKGEELSLLAKADGIEIMTQKIMPNLVFWIDPGEKEGLMEFFYILKGRVLWESKDTSVELKEGEYYYVHDLKESTHFRTLTEATLLYVSSQPVFHLLSEEIVKLTDMKKTVREKDMYTHDHGSRLEDYAIRIGEKLNFSQKRLDILYYSSLFHDIGKINVPDYILKKPGKLTAEEFDLIKRHPVDGADIIKSTFLKESQDAILQHHERLDGSGYPRGLKGEDICMEAKIIAVVDSYDAMTSDRPYRKGFDPRDAFEEIKSLIGRHYDRDVVFKFEEVLKEDGIL